RVGHESVDPVDGRTVCGARCADARNPAGGIAAADGAAERAQDDDVHHAFDRRGDPAWRPHRGDERATGPHQGGARHAVRMAAPSRRRAVRSALRRASPAHLASAVCRSSAADASTEGGRVTAVEQASRELADGARELSGERARAERVAAERRHRRALVNLAIRLVSPAIALTLWEVAAWNIDPVLFPSPSKVA